MVLHAVCIHWHKPRISPLAQSDVCAAVFHDDIVMFQKKNLDHLKSLSIGRSSNTQLNRPWLSMEYGRIKPKYFIQWVLFFLIYCQLVHSMGFRSSSTAERQTSWSQSSNTVSILLTDILILNTQLRMTLSFNIVSFHFLRHKEN
jgi:hypothetical protein